MNRYQITGIIYINTGMNEREGGGGGEREICMGAGWGVREAGWKHE